MSRCFSLVLCLQIVVSHVSAMTSSLDTALCFPRDGDVPFIARVFALRHVLEVLDLSR